MIFEALKSELFRLNFHSLSSKILKISEFNLDISHFSIDSQSNVIKVNHGTFSGKFPFPLNPGPPYKIGLGISVVNYTFEIA